MSKNALLIIDLQNGVCRGEKDLYQLSELLEKVNRQIEMYRKQELPIIFIQHEDEDLVANTFAWELVPELQATKNDYFVAKTHANSFYQTDLKTLLDKLAINQLEILGAQTQYCMDSTIKFAHGLGYQLFLHYGGASTVDNAFMTAKMTNLFYENLWQNRFAKFIAN